MSLTSKPKLFKIKELVSTKGNKEFLLDNFGYKTIHEAKKDFGGNASQVYDYMLKAYNTQILKENKVLKKEYLKRKGDFDLQQINKKLAERAEKRKRSYDVVISATVDTTWTKQNRSYETVEVFEKSFVAKNKDELASVISTWIQQFYPVDDGYKLTTLKSFTFKVRDIIKNKVNIMDVPMKRGKPLTTSFLKCFKSIDKISYEDHGGECVVKILKQFLGIKRDATLTDVFNEASQKFYNKDYVYSDGVTARMLLHFCKEKNISCLGFDQQTNMFVKNVADKSKGYKYKKSIVFYSCLSHFYLITDPDTVLSLTRSFQQLNNRFHSSLEIGEEKKENEEINYHRNLSVEQCLDLGKNDVVIYDSQDLINELKEYVNITHDTPHIKYHTITQVGKLILKNKCQLVISGCFTEGLDWEEVKQICEQNDIVFYNQSFGTLLSQLRDKFYSTRRATFSKDVRNKILEEQSGKCKTCKDIIGEAKFDIDHIKPISAGGTNERENLQALCQSCHREKCRAEKDACEYVQCDNILSAYNMQVLEVMKGDFFRKVAFTENLPVGDNYEMEKFSIDMNKCRRNILLNYGAEFARYSVLDDIQPFSGKITTGFYYVETLNSFPLRQNGFYSKPMIDYCLKLNIIELDNIKYEIKPSFTIEANYFKDFVNHLLSVFSNNPDFQKLSVNCLVGLFGRRKHTIVENRVCAKDEKDDIACAYQDFHKPYINEINDELVSITAQCEIKKIENYFPIHAQILDCEAIELHRLVQRIEKRGGIPCAIKTDAVNYYASEPIEINAFWDKEKTIVKYKHEEPSDIVRGVKITSLNKFVYEKEKYNEVEEQTEFDDIANQIVSSEKGCLILGSAGCGKTYLVNNIIKKLEECNITNIRRLAPTNKSALLINGETLDKFAYSLLNGKKQLKKIKNVKYLFVDECSMVRELFLQVLLMLKHYNNDIKMIVVGDFGQLPPVNDRVNKSSEFSRVLYELCDGNKLTLTKCKRSNSTLFDICEAVRRDEIIDTNRFKITSNVYTNLAYTNRTRQLINHHCNEKYVSEHPNFKRVNITALSFDKNSQNFTLMKGMPLIARINQKQMDIVNNEQFVVKDIHENEIVVENELKKEIKVPINKINRLFYLAFCITIHKSQGATFNSKYTIHEWGLLDKKLKYVALSRGTDENNIQIV